MNIKYKNFEIEVSDDPDYNLNSANNQRQYKKVYSEENRKQNIVYPESKHTIIIKESGIEISSSIICEVGWTVKINHNTFIIEDDKIWIISCAQVYCLEIPTLELIWKRDFDSFTLFSLYKLENDFIIHGEVEIFRITREGEIIWSFGGRDIWVNTKGKTEFSIENNIIKLYDFESNEYIIDFDGNQLEDNPVIIQKEINKKWWKIFG